MGRRPVEPLRPLSVEEIEEVRRLSRSKSERADGVVRAQVLLAVAEGKGFKEATRSAGRKSDDAVAHLVSRFNREGLEALWPRHAGGPPVRYGALEKERILRELERPPDRVKDGTATWSLTTLQKALRRAPDGLPEVSTFTILGTLHEAGYSWQADRSWCKTGEAERKRKAGVVTVTDPEREGKKL